MKKLLIIVTVGLSLAAITYFSLKTFYFDQKATAIEVVFSENMINLNPYTLDNPTLQRLRLVYEPLVRLDSDLTIQPAIASGFGRINDTTWEFTIPTNIHFHDGTLLTTEIVVANLKAIQKMSDFAGITRNIESIDSIANNTVQIVTKTPDSTLLNKFTNVLITATPDDLAKLEKSTNGTGPYIVKSFKNNTLTLTENLNYYGRLPKFETIKMTAIPNALSRIDYVNTHDVDLLIPAPSGFLEYLNPTLKVETFPTNSVNFFIFNLNTPVFKSIEFRKFLNQILSDEFILTSIGNNGRTSKQYVSQGVYGFNSAINNEKLTTEEAVKIVNSRGYAGTTFKVALPQGLEIFRDILIQEFNKFGLIPTIDLVNPELLLNRNTIQSYDLVFLGWKSDYGNSISFFENFVVENPGFPYFNYHNFDVNKLIQKYNTSTDDDEKLTLLREAMRIISEVDPIGIPLFESEEIYAIHEKYSYTPRIDGYFEPSNLNLN